MKNPKVITLDFETFYDGEYSLSKMTTEAYIRDPRFEVIGVSIKLSNGPAVWFSGTMAETKAYLSSIDWSDKYLIAHNAAFDAAILSWHFNIRPAFVIDTLSMARPLHGLTVGGSLAALAKHYDLGVKGTEVVQAKGKRRADFTPEERAAYGAYCCNDVDLTRALFLKLAKGFPYHEMRIINLLLRMYTEPVLRLDSHILEQHLIDVLRRKEELLHTVGITKAGLGSATKFCAALRQLGVSPPMKLSPAALKKGKEAWVPALAKTDAGMQALLEHPDDRVQALAAARLGTKGTLEETRTKAFIGIAVRGTLPIMLNYYGAHTGRASGGEKINLQNLPRGGALRKSIHAPMGHTLVVGDSSQIEARITAWVAGQDDLVAAFEYGEDIYASFATELYGYKVTKETAPIERQVGKVAILGLGFGMGAKKFKLTVKNLAGIDLTIEAAERAVKLYRAKYRAIAALWRKCHRALEHMTSGSDEKFYIFREIYAQGNRIYLPNGMHLTYPSLERTVDGDYTYAQRREVKKIYGAKVVENLIQALARIIVFDQMEFLSRSYKVVLTVHDEIVMSVPDTEAEAAERRVQIVMKTAPKWASGLPITCETGRAHSYGLAKG